MKHQPATDAPETPRPAAGRFRMPLGPNCEVTLTTVADAASVREPGVRYYQSNIHRSEHGTRVDLTNLIRTAPSDISRDDGWRRRRELAEILSAVAADLGLPLADARRGAPLALLVASYQASLPEGSTATDVWHLLAANSQRLFDAVVPSLLAGQREYDVDAYARLGVNQPEYSHIEHFGWIYARQIAAIDLLLDRYPHRTLRVADLGTGCGHFLATLAGHLVRTGRERRVTLLGIDACRDRLDCSREALALFSTCDVELVRDDLVDTAFADRLRRLHPDVVVANHVVEHLEGEVVNRYLQDWMLAARLALSVSVPLGDEPANSISEHTAAYTVDSVTRLGRSMEIRVGMAAEALALDETKVGGLCTWVRPPAVADWGGFSPTIVAIVPCPIAIAPDPLLDDFATPFDPTRFNHVRRAPCIGRLKHRERFATLGRPRQVRQLLIKGLGGPTLVPAELAEFEEAIQTIVNHNAAANPLFYASYAYLNVFQGRTGFSSYRGLSLNCHGDQLQSLRGESPYLPDWSYIVSSALPTMLYEQAFDVSDAVALARAGETVNLYDTLNQQASDAHLYRSENFGIYLLSPYVVHSAAIAEDDIERVFMKVAFSTKRFFDNRELRRNPAFDIEAWYDAETVGRIDGWLSHDHWNERFLRADVCPAAPEFTNSEGAQ